MADQIREQGGRPTMTFQTKSSPDQGSKGVDGGRGDLPPPPSPHPPPPCTYTHTNWSASCTLDILRQLLAKLQTDQSTSTVTKRVLCVHECWTRKGFHRGPGHGCTHLRQHRLEPKVPPHSWFVLYIGKDVHLETGKRIVIYVEILCQRW